MSGERMESSLPIIAPWSRWRRWANTDRRPACYVGGARRSSVGLVLADGAASNLSLTSITALATSRSDDACPVAPDSSPGSRNTS